MNALGIGCHLDDLRVSWGRALVRYAEQSHKVFMYHIVNDNRGHKVIQPEEFNKIRAKGAEEATGTLSAEVFPLDIGDACVVASYMAQDVSFILPIPHPFFMGRIKEHEYKFN